MKRLIAVAAAAAAVSILPATSGAGTGRQAWSQAGCGGCHTLAAAKSGGVTGPNLNEVLPGQSAAMIKESIEDPNAKIAKGYPANVMPQNFHETLTPKEIENLVEYLIESTSTGGGKGGSGGKGA